MLDPHLEERHRELAAAVRRVGEERLRVVARDEEDPQRRAAEIGARLAEAGLLRCAVPAPFGSLDARSALVVPLRRKGRTVRSTVDCLIAQIAIDNGLRLLHDDADFDAIQAGSKLRTYP